MKTIKFLNVLLAIIVFASCSKEESIVQEIEADLKSKITVNKSTSLVSEILYNTGLESITVNKKEKNLTYDFESKNKKQHQNLIVNGMYIDLFDKSYILENDYIYLNGNKEIKLTFVGNEPFVKSNNFTGYLRDNVELINDRNLIALLIVMNEITLNESSKFITLQDNNRNPNPPSIERPCSFWNTYYSVGIGLNSSAAWSNYHYNNQNDTNSGDLIGCEAIGDPEHTSLGVVHYVTRAYCCN